MESSYPHTLSGLLSHVANKFPSRRAISASGKIHLTHSELHRLVCRASSHLSSSGISPGDVVALTFPNSLEFVITFLAVIKARAVAAPLNPAYTAEEFEFYLSDSGSKLLLTDRTGHAAAQEAASKLGIPRHTGALSDTASDFTFSLTSSESESDSVTELVNDPEDVALFLHTSGTTSRPKGVPLTQLNLLSSVKNIISVYRLTESDSTVVVLPLFHVHGLIASLLGSLGSGGSVLLPAAGRFSASTFWSDMKSIGATWYTAVPTIHQILLDRHLNRPEPEYPRLRFIRSCSASLAPSIMAQLEETFKAPVLEAYAMTEACHIMCSNPVPEDGPHKPGSVGKAVGQEMAILNEKGEILPKGENGEVCVRGPNVTKGYKDAPEANQTVFMYGWFHTGDIGYLDDDGFLHLVGRIKELINRGAILDVGAGEKISPIEVDAVLIAHPDVAQAVSFGVPDDKYGEEINCAVIPREGSNLTEEDVLRFCRKNLAAFKSPKKVFITDSLPKTATGKIQRRFVAEHFLSQISTAKVPNFVTAILDVGAGEKISPIEVDAVLIAHPDVAQAVSFGVPDDKYGEEINCAVIPREGSNLTEEDVLRFCRKNLAAFKSPKKVFITDSLPKTATGKIQRRFVAEHFLSQISTAKVPNFVTAILDVGAGEKISPIEVDAVLIAHPDVAQAVSFGVPDDKYGEEINCAVIPREGSNLTEEDVLRFCRKNLAAFKSPKKVFITDSLPKTATGKIQRRFVAEHFLSQISTAKVPKFGA
ncbi:hypothetical protein V2J09_022227 [Rumex salicifolius]